jgi:hypothetical protein
MKGLPTNLLGYALNLNVTIIGNSKYCLDMFEYLKDRVQKDTKYVEDSQI